MGSEMCIRDRHVVVQSRVSPCLQAENDLSPMALVAGVTSNSFPRVEISPNSFLREFQNPLTLLSMVKAKVVLLKESKSPLRIFTTSASSVSHCSLAKDFNKISGVFTYISKSSCSNLVTTHCVTVSIAL